MSKINSDSERGSILDLLQLIPSAESKDYVENKKKFQLHHLSTEKRNPLTQDFSFKAKKEIELGIRDLFLVDEKLSDYFDQISSDETLVNVLQPAVSSIKKAVLGHKKIYIYGADLQAESRN
jgi:hypothetical protein